MRLIAFSVEGYRRFVSKTSVKLHGDTIAFVGPNEAGKSTLLRALAHLGNTSPFEPKERPRRTNLNPKLTWHLQLEPSDKAAITNIPDSSHVERIVISKGVDGKRSWYFEPRNPQRDRSERLSCADLMEKWMNEVRAVASIGNPDGSSAWTKIEPEYLMVKELLVEDVADYDAEQIQHFRWLVDALRAVVSGLDVREFESESLGDDLNSLHKGHFEKLIDVLNSTVEREAGDSPWRQVVNALKGRLPVFILFEEADRNLASSYDLAEVAGSPPRALKHLAALADLDLAELLREAQAQQFADVATRRDAANAKLMNEFRQSWNQQGIAIQIEVQGATLHIHASSPEDSGQSEIGDRSDGMRWFAALLAFSHSWPDKPILLVDEIETHLHYDAQADLIALLSKQRFTSKVIYTTHSFGCLPYDLGTGVRVVQQVDSTTSRLQNGFWSTGAGFSPLLASMGAAVMSFTPTRRALIAEGPADAILLPTLLRQASGLDKLSFQIAPGLSGVAALTVSELDLEAGRVGFVVDGDSGGGKIAGKLAKGGFSAGRIVSLRDDQSGLGFEVEDLVDPDVYVLAVNEELRCWNELASEVTTGELGDSFRSKALKRWCDDRGYSYPDKTAVAQRVVDFSVQKPVYYEARRDNLREFLKQFQEILGLLT